MQGSTQGCILAAELKRGSEERQTTQRCAPTGGDFGEASSGPALLAGKLVALVGSRKPSSMSLLSDRKKPYREHHVS